MASIFLCHVGIAQNNNTTSPFSRYGLGELASVNYGRSAAMGGASIGSRHAMQINATNPATYSSIDSLSFLFNMGFDGSVGNYKSNSGKLRTNDVNFRYFAMNFPITRWAGAGMGIQPFSDMGYEVAMNQTIEDFGTVSHSYFGNGTLSKAYIGGAIKPFKNLSIGANLNYIFGELKQNSSVYFPESGALYVITRAESTRLRDFNLTYGFQYDIDLKKNKYLTIGATFENQTDMTALHSLLSAKQLNLSSTTLRDTLKYVSEKKDKIIFPQSLGVGASFTKINNFEISADYYTAKWSKAEFFGSSNELITDLNRFSAGLEYIPDAYSIRSFWKRVRYRSGFHYENSYLVLNNRQIDEIGISFGAGIPLVKSKSIANFALEFGRKGTMKDDLVRNNYMKFSVYLDLFDYWFVKRKFD